MEESKLELATLVSVPFEENTYVARLTPREDCLVIDPGLEPEIILEYLERRKLTPGAILITHGHADHIGGSAALKRRWPECPLVIGSGDAAKLTDPVLNLSAAFGDAVESPPADVTIEDGNVYSAAGFHLDVLTIPGHSEGHVVYVWKRYSPYVAFVGDVIFAGSVGRTDFPGGSFAQLSQGIRSKLFTLPDDTVLLSGHGPRTTVAQEKRTNPFVGEGAQVDLA